MLSCLGKLTSSMLTLARSQKCVEAVLASQNNVKKYDVGSYTKPNVAELVNNIESSFQCRFPRHFCDATSRH